jgi:ABC-type lipoprotein export system ATPase subunit
MTELTIHAGRDKQGRPEGYGRLEFKRGEVVAVVGTTGSGKSRLLADVETLAAGDSPSRRRVEVSDGAAWRVARVSQQMQFSLDLRVADFLRLHGRALGLADAEIRPDEVVAWANLLVGEPFGGDSPLALLSGGQSRALMIADALLVARSDVLLVDEIENAGIHRAAALERLLGTGALVFLATHDPLVALLATRRLVMAEGAVRQVRQRTEAESARARQLAVEAEDLERVRVKLCLGDEIT